MIKRAEIMDRAPHSNNCRYLACQMLIVAAVGLQSVVHAQQADTGADIDFNYVYSAVLGTGYYKAGSERVLVLRIPISWRLPELDEKNRLRLLFPISFGVRDLINSEGDFEFPDQLLTTSFLPGIAWEHLARPQWVLIPSLQVGGAKDLQLDTSAWLGTIALRSYAWWDIGKYRLALGNRLLGATQYNKTNSSQSGFVLLENGLDWEYPLPWAPAGRALSSSVYILWQHYANDVRLLEELSGEQVNLTNVYQLGTTFGFRKPVTLLGFIPIQRVGLSLGRGNTLSGEAIKTITMNLGFPLSYQ